MTNNEINWISTLPNKLQGINLILDHIYAIKRQKNNWLNAAIGTKIIDAYAAYWIYVDLINLKMTGRECHCEQNIYLTGDVYIYIYIYKYLFTYSSNFNNGLAKPWNWDVNE